MLAIDEWRKHWGIKRDPFLSKDAEHDSILLERGVAAAHPEFEKVLGEMSTLGPSLVFGEKGSGKSGLRMMVKQRLEEWNGAHPDQRVLILEYIDFNSFLEHLGKSQAHVRKKKRTGWDLADHIDAILSLGVTRLVDLCLAKDVDAKALQPKQRTELLLLTALYHLSEERTTSEATRKMHGLLRGPVRASLARRFGVLLLIALALSVIGWSSLYVPAVNTLRQWIVDHVLAEPVWIGAAFGVWVLAELMSQLVLGSRARKHRRAVRILPPESSPLKSALAEIRRRDLSEFGLPEGRDDEIRFKLLKHFLHISDQLGYPLVCVLMDRVDEPGSVAGNAKIMREFVEPLMNVKLLTLKELALKLFLPIELREIQRTASPDSMKQMRFDRWHEIEELRWTGNELYDIGNRRLKASLDEGATVDLALLFDDEIGRELLEGTLDTLGTPRLAFGFLNDVFQEHARTLDAELGGEADGWRVSRPVFERVRGHWLTRAGEQRRLLNS